ncbi:MAG: GNAT family N-acetyltransferase [Sandaracinaceae bacterium]|nr:GNAT family N-acetyltransferase [Sandaracinaceae bacterium]
MWPEPPYAIHTARLTLRCYERADVAAAHPVIVANAAALAPWLPWVAREPIALEERAAQLRAIRGRFDLGEDFVYGAFLRASGQYVGGAGLHARVGPRALEIGYWLAQDAWGQGLGTELAGALTRVGFERLGALRMEIRVAPANERSLAIPRKLGYTEEGTLRGALAYEGRPDRQDLVVFGMMLGELAASPAARGELELEGFAP